MSESPLFDNKFGIVLVDEEPPAPKVKESNKELWETVKFVLSSPAAAGKWAKVKEFKTHAAASQKASQINNDNVKALPANEWEARYTSEKGEGENDPGSSVLFLRFKGTPVTPEQPPAEAASN